MSTEIQAVPTASPGPRPPRALRLRRVALRAVYTLLSLWALVMAQGVALLVAGRAVPGWSFTFAASSVFKLLALGAAVPLAWTAGRRVGAARWLATGVLAWLVAEALTGQLGLVEGVTTGVLWLGPWLALAPERRQLLAWPARPPLLAVCGAVAATAGLAVWATRTAGVVPVAYPPVFSGPDALADLRLDLTGVPVTLAAATLLAVAAGSRSRAARVVAGTAALATGVAAVVWPADLGSPGVLGGAALLLGGGALLTWALLTSSLPDPSPAGRSPAARSSRG